MSIVNGKATQRVDFGADGLTNIEYVMLYNGLSAASVQGGIMPVGIFGLGKIAPCRSLQRQAMET